MDELAEPVFYDSIEMYKEEKMNYTKGEWKVEVNSYSTTVYAPSQTICINVSNCNANLIAAAPKLHKALLAVYQDIELQNVEGGSDELNLLVQEALAKADTKEVRE